MLAPRSTFVRRFVVPAVAIALAITALSQSPSTQAPPVSVPDAVTAQIASDGTAMIVVGVRTPFTPEGLLASPAEVTAQRDAMHAAVDGVMGEAAAAGALVGQRFETIPFFTARVDAAGLAALAALPSVASIEHDALNFPLLGQSVPLINVDDVWAMGYQGTGQVVAVLDTGVDKNHPFFGGRVVSEACYSNAGGAGVGTSLCPGGAGSSTAPNSGLHCNTAVSGCDHGTHVAGIAAGANGTGGIHGVARASNIIAVQVFTQFTGSTNCGSVSPCVAAYNSDITFGLERVGAVAGAGNVNNVASANMSLGGGSSAGNCDTVNSSTIAMKAAIDNLRSNRIATVIATGNNGFTTSISSPACISTSIRVGSTTKTDTISSFSNRGSFFTPSMLMAPGSSINASIPGTGFGIKSGTSMATPHVAGAWGLLRQVRPSASVSDIFTALHSTGVVITDTGGTTYRRINVHAAALQLLGGGTGVPGPPGAPTFTGSGNSIGINWTAPVTGGAATSFNLLARLTPGGPLVVDSPVGNVLGINVNAPNGTFIVSVRASNASGSGPESPGSTLNVPFLPPAPGPPSGLTVSVNVNQAQFGWTPPTTGGTPSIYNLIAASTPGGTPIAQLNFPAPANQLLVSNIPGGTYFVKLAAGNAGGFSAYSNEVMLVVAPPGAPTLNTATVSSGQVGLSWTAGAGPAATSFIIRARLAPGGPVIASLPVTGTGITVPAPSGTYFVTVQGVNAVGVGPESNQITVVVP
jgi:subtilisin family serine protease